MSKTEDASVGYKRPPVATRFKPGVSGNPSGRPKKIKSLQTELLEELGEVMRIREGDAELEISKARAIAKSLVGAAIDGNLRAATVLLALCSKGLGDADDAGDPANVPHDNDILDDYVNREIRRRASEHAETNDSTTPSNPEEKE